MSETRYLPFTLLAVALALALPDAPAAGQQKPDPPKGTVERITVHGRSLEGNLEGDSPDRALIVYLPPSYAKEATRRYPVLYYLHGYAAIAEAYSGSMYSNSPTIGDWETFIAQDLPAFIDTAPATGRQRVSPALPG